MMKVGRNEKCPCGSGKKYKYCCMNENNSTFKILEDCSHLDQIGDCDGETAFSAYPEKREQIFKIFSNYSYGDIVRAVYCINSWRDNRSAMFSVCLSLNEALKNVPITGQQRINNYSEFCSFFAEVQEVFQPNIMDDLTLSDFGEVSINVDGQNYPLILGTGEENLFSKVFFLIELAELLGKSKEIHDVLDYNRLIIESLSQNNIPTDEDKEEIILYVPSVSFWEDIKSLFNDENFKEKTKLIPNTLKDVNNHISRVHTITKNGDVFPLFNVFIMANFYDQLLKEASKTDIQKHTERTLCKAIHEVHNFFLQRENPKILFPVYTLEEDRPVLRCSFFTKTSSSSLLAINADFFDENSSLEDKLLHLAKHHKNDTVNLCEMRPIARNEQKTLGTSIEPSEKLKVIVHTSIPKLTQTKFNSDDGVFFYCSSSDLFFMLLMCDDLSEIADFIDYYINEDTRIFAYCGIVSVFNTWKRENYMIEKGARNYDLLSISYGEMDNALFNYYKNLTEYPIHSQNQCFRNPFAWIAKPYMEGFVELTAKSNKKLMGHGKLIDNNIFVFIFYNFDIIARFKECTYRDEIIHRTIDELIIRSINNCSNTLSKMPLLQNKVFKLIYLPIEYARQLPEHDFLNDDNKTFVYSDIYIEEDAILIRFSVKEDDFMLAYEASSNKEIEIQFFEELLSPLENYDRKWFDSLKKQLNETMYQPKEIGIFSAKIDYYFSEELFSWKIEEHSFMLVRKRIAQICLASGIERGEYTGKKATEIIRTIQSAITADFEAEILEFDKETLHIAMLSYLANSVHELKAHKIRYEKSSSLNMTVVDELKNKIIKAREKERRNIATVLYVIETNLFLKGHLGTVSCDENSLNFILAYADWILVLQDNADDCHHFDSNSNFLLEVESDFLVNTIIPEDAKSFYDQLTERKYEYSGSILHNDDADKQFLLDAINAFEKDVDFSFQIFLDVVQYFQLLPVKDICEKTSRVNVFTILKEKFIESFRQETGDRYAIEEIEKVLKYITINEELLKTAKGETHSLLPVWEREYRDNRFELRPLSVFADTIIFSPVVVFYTLEMWRSGIVDWYIPHQVGLNELGKELKKWKKFYEVSMVEDIEKEFKNRGFDIVRKNLELHKINERHHPEELGDYDVFAISKSRQEVWIIECKVIQKVGSTFEFYNQQRWLFEKDGEAEKFQHRIDHITLNFSQVMQDLGVNDAENYRLIPYLVANKIFASHHKEIAFEIVSLAEFKHILNQ